MIVGIDWGFVGVLVGIAAVVVSVALYFLGGFKRVKLGAKVDKTGLVHVSLRKSGLPTVHIRDVKVLRANSSDVLPIISRDPSGAFDISGAGRTSIDCYILLDNYERSADTGVDVQVWLSQKKSRRTTAEAIQGAIKLPDGVRLVAT